MAMTLCSLIYNKKQGINNSGNDFESIMNTGSKLYSSLSQLTRRPFLVHTELPTLLNVLKADCDLNIVKTALVSFMKKLQ